MRYYLLTAACACAVLYACLCNTFNYVHSASVADAHAQEAEVEALVR